MVGVGDEKTVSQNIWLKLYFKEVDKEDFPQQSWWSFMAVGKISAAVLGIELPAGHEAAAKSQEEQERHQSSKG